MIYLKDIALQNFKCFEEMPQLELGKITLLTGANSTGKSSLIYGILGTLQGGEYPLIFSVNGRYVEMGNFLEMVNNHDGDKKISISQTFVDSESGLSYLIKTVWEKDDVGNPRMFSCECSSKYFHLLQNRKSNGDFYLSLDYEPAKNPNSIKLQELLYTINQEDDKFKDVIDFLKYSSEEVHVKNICILKKGGTLSDVDSNIRYPYLSVLKDITETLAKYDKSVNYISSFRQPAQRIYPEKNGFKEKIASNGEGFINELLTWKDSNDIKFDSFVKSMKDIGVLADVIPTRMGDGQFKVNIRVHENDKEVNLSDAGFGISQFMPIIISDVELGKDSTLYISQPEVHLHPKAQANFGDYLVSQIDQNKRYVIETHSEYLINRLRLAIVNGDMPEEDIKVYYISQENEGTKLHTISFNRKGQIIGAPKDFFDTYMIDVMDIAMKAE